SHQWVVVVHNSGFRHPLEEVDGIIDRWFERAGTLPLSLNWFGGAGNNWSEQINIIVRRYAPRLQFLDLHINAHCITRLIDGVTFPRLQKLYLENLDDGFLPTGTSPMLMFSNAPRLRQVVLSNIPPSFLVLPWESLESFTMGDLPGASLDVLRMSPLLRKLSVQNPSGNTVIHDGSIVLHARLNSPSLWNTTDEILQYFAFPTLEDLQLANISFLNNNNFLSFLSRTRGSLRYFTISHRLEPLILSVEWFGYMRHLTDLYLPHLEQRSWVDFVSA
ncbi:hypothetical protein C8F04DRAFT_247190, partial [Mycena alexandri]